VRHTYRDIYKDLAFVAVSIVSPDGWYLLWLL